MITSRTLQLGNFLRYYAQIVKVAEIRSTDCVIQFEDGTLLPVNYNTLSGAASESNVLLAMKCITKISTKKLPLHVKEIFQIDILGKKYFINLLVHGDSIICRFDSFLSFEYVHELQNICTLVNKEFFLNLFQ